MNPFSIDGIPDLTGMRVIVTGANSGLGLQTSIALAGKGAEVTLACRNRGRGAAALNRLRESTGSTSCELRLLDLASLSSIRAFCASWEGPLDVLINNAGVMATPRGLTEDGFEQQLGINHLGHFALTGLLLPYLRLADAPRVVVVSSLAHRRGVINFEDLHSTSRYRRWTAYNQSKIANLYFAVELDRRVRAAGDKLTVTAAHPGVVNTNLPRDLGHPATLDVVGGFFRLVGQHERQGSLPILYAATAEDVQGGEFFGPDAWGGMRGNVTMAAPAPQVADRTVAGRLWEVSEDLTGVRYEGLPAA